MCVPDDRSRNAETSLANGCVCPQNKQVATASRTYYIAIDKKVPPLF